ncbi:hypothetical protein EDD11_003819 [Mortierella claussenii]|nr:hypothetical protein EDD11_003819 [Mortierella claussenii]
MSDSHYCHVHWRDADLINMETELESEDLPEDAFFEQEMLQMEQKWTDQDLPTVVEPVQQA